MSAPGDDSRSGAPGPGLAPPPAVRCATLAPGDLERVYAVHLAAMAAVGDPKLVKPEDRGFFERLLERLGGSAGRGQRGTQLRRDRFAFLIDDPVG